MIKNRLKNVATIQESHLNETPPAPLSIKVELTSRCNYRCQYCALSSRNSKGSCSDMEMWLFKKIMKEARESGVRDFGVFYIGESFVRPKMLVEAITYLKHDLRVPYVFLTTNGSLATAFYLKECMEAGLDSLKFSCNYADTEQFTEMCRVNPVYFDSSIRAVATARRIRDSYGFTTKIYASSIMHDEKQPERMENLLRSQILPYVDQHYWLPLFAKSGVIGNLGLYDDPVQPLPCWAVFTAAHVMVDGRMTACCHDATGRWAVGDLATNHFMEVWHSEKFKNLRRAHLKRDVSNTVCNRCVHGNFMEKGDDKT